MLLISYEFPPRGGSGVQRVAKFAKYLPRFGWEPLVLTVADPPTPVYDATLLDELPQGLVVARAYSLEPTRLVVGLSRLRSRLLGRQTGGAASTVPSSRGRRNLVPLPLSLIKGIQGFFLPDEKIGWLPWASRLGAEVARASGVRALFSSGPPHTAHLVALRIKAAAGLPWIADFRDPWVESAVHLPLTPLHRRMNARLEAKVVAAADRVVSVNPGTTEGFLSRYPQAPAAKFHTLSNGFDPEDFARLDGGESSGKAGPAGSGDWIITHAGTFYGDRNPRAFLVGFREAMTREPELARRARVRFVGAVAPEVRMIVRESGIGDRVEFTGYVPHRESIAHLLSSSALLLIAAATGESRLHLAGKLFEYLAAERPILALVGEGAAGEIVRECRAGRVVSPDHPEEIAGAILDLFASWREKAAFEPDLQAVGRYSRVAQAEWLAGALDAVAERTGK